jgi:hypothetical protein
LFQITNGVIVLALHLNSIIITRNLQIKFESKSDSNRKYKTEFKLTSKHKMEKSKQKTGKTKKRKNIPDRPSSSPA